MQKMNIVFSTDDNYAMPTGAAIASLLLTNSKYSFDVYILTTGLSDKCKKLLSEPFEKITNTSKLYIKNIDASLFSNCPIRAQDHVSVATYFRIVMPSIIGDDIHRILYIDSDMLIIDDISEYYNSNLDGFSCAAVRDCRFNDKESYDRLGYDQSLGYFDAGNILINLDYWRKHDIQNTTMKFITEHGDICKWHDQDALNYVLRGTVNFVAFKYNVLHQFYQKTDGFSIAAEFMPEIEDATKNPVIIHYSSGYKPWHKESVSPLKEFYKKMYSICFGRNLKLSHKLKGKDILKRKIKHILHIAGIKYYKEYVILPGFEEVQKKLIQDAEIKYSKQKKH